MKKNRVAFVSLLLFGLIGCSPKVVVVGNTKTVTSDTTKSDTTVRVKAPESEGVNLFGYCDSLWKLRKVDSTVKYIPQYIFKTDTFTKTKVVTDEKGLARLRFVNDSLDFLLKNKTITIHEVDSIYPDNYNQLIVDAQKYKGLVRDLWILGIGLAVVLMIIFSYRVR